MLISNMAAVLASLIIILLFPKGLSCLKCYTCEQHSDCSKVKKEAVCPQGPLLMDRCLKIIDYSDIERVARSCSNIKFCQMADKKCKEAKEARTGDCELKCCATDLCNAGPTLSAFHWLSVVYFIAVAMLVNF